MCQASHAFNQYSEKLGYEEVKLEVASKVTLIAYQSDKKANKEKPGEKENATAKATRLVKVKATKVELEKPQIAESTIACLAYDLFRKLL